MNAFKEKIADALSDEAFQNSSQLARKRLVFSLPASPHGLEVHLEEAEANTSTIFKQNSDGEAIYFGTAAVNTPSNVLPAWLATTLNLDDCTFHSGYGIYIPLKNSSNFLPPTWGLSAHPCVHILCAVDGWRWRLVRSRPGSSARPFNSNDIILFFMENISQQIAIELSDISSRDIGNLPQWCDPVKDEELRDKSASEQSLQYELIGVTLTVIKEKAVPLRFQPTFFIARCMDEVEGIYAMELFEKADGEPLPKTMPYELGFEEKTLVLKNEWQLEVGLLPPEEAAAVETEPNPQRALWAHAEIPDEWIRMGVSRFVDNPASGETRRWALGNLLPSFPDSMSFALWFDNCGPKSLRAIFKAGKFESLTLRLQRPFIELRLDNRFWCSSHSPRDALPAVSSRVLSESQPGQMGVLVSALEAESESRASLQVRLGVNGALTIKHHTDNNAMAIHWVRSKASLVSPLEWSRNDPASLAGISLLRGLLPLQCEGPQVKVSKDKVDIVLDRDPGYTFPDFTHRRRLLVASSDENRSRLELEISEKDNAIVRLRHASPHLDAHYARAGADELSTVAREDADESLTWVTDRFAKGTDDDSATTLAEMEIVAKQLVDELPDITSGGTEGLELLEHTPSFAGTDHFDVLRYLDWKRWSVVPKRPLFQTLGANLRIDTFSVRLEGEAYSVEFAIVAAKCEECAKFRQSMLTSTSNSLSGSMALSSKWLSEHHSSERQVDWRERADEVGPTVEFLGIESRDVSLSDSSMLLQKLRYWFNIDSHQFSIATSDSLNVSEGRWAFGEGGADMRLDDGNAKWLATFEQRSHIAPDIEVIETLLAGSEDTLLSLEYNKARLPFVVLTSYFHDPQATGVHKALMRGGSYHLAWAGEHAKDAQVGSCVEGVTLGPLTRLFLQLERSADGKLEASGMIGWSCLKLSIGDEDYASDRLKEVRATLYAQKHGNWSRLRLSGRWNRTDFAAGAVPSPKAVVLPRVDFDLHGDQPLTITNSDGDFETAPILVEYSRSQSGGESSAFCFQALQFNNGVGALTGQVRFRNFDTQKLGGATKLRTSTLSIECYEPMKLREALHQSDVGLPWYALDGTDSAGSPLQWMSLAEPKVFEPGELIKPSSKVGNLAGLTRLRGSDRWMLCSVRTVGSPYGPNKRPKLWLFHKGGEDLIEFDGFDEELGAGLSKTDMKDIEPMRRAAERMLSFMRWRTPAVLEYWEGDGAKWVIVDAPLLNPFSSLAFMEQQADLPDTLRQPDPGRISLKALPAIQTDGLRWLAQDSDPPQSTRRLQVVHPESYDRSQLQMCREVWFEKGPNVETYGDPANGDDVWLAESARWTICSQAQHDVGAGDVINDWRSLLPDTQWKMATPRPGERVSFTVEAAWAANEVEEPIPKCWISSTSTVTARSRRGSSNKISDAFEQLNETIVWPVGKMLPPDEQPIEASGLTPLIGSPNAKSVSVNKPFDIAVINADASNNNKSLVLRFEFPMEFRLDIQFDGKSSGSIRSKIGGDGALHQLYMVILRPDHGKIFTALIETQGYAGKEVGSVVAKVWDAPEGDQLLRSEIDVELPGESAPEIKLSQPDLRVQPGIPTTVAILDTDKRVLAYGPNELHYRLARNGEDLMWQAYGKWSAPGKSVATSVHEVVLIGQDGAVTGLARNIQLGS